MSVRDLSRFIEKNVLKVLRKDMRPYLDAAIQRIEINEKTTVANLKKYVGVGDARAKEIFRDIIVSATAFFGPALTRADFKNSTIPYRKNVFDMDREFDARRPHIPLKSRYGVIDRWKRNKLGPALFAKWGKRVPKIADFSSDFHLGHGSFETGQGKALSAVAYRQGEAVRSLKERGGVLAENFISTILDEASLLKGIDVHAHAETWFDYGERVDRDYVVYLDMQWGDANVTQGREIEKVANQKLIRIFDDLLKDKTRLENWAYYTGTSTPYLKYIDNAITSNVLGKKVKKEKSKVKTKKSTKGTSRRQRLVPPIFKAPKLRNERGQFTSAMNIQAILNAKIKETVADNMGEGGALVYRTGRFAGSVTVDKVMQSRQGVLTAYYTYMKAPYQTFERGFKQGSFRRDPRKLISASIREIARETLSHKLHIRTRRV
jgi:hypothetical protein